MNTTDYSQQVNVSFLTLMFAAYGVERDAPVNWRWDDVWEEAA